MSAAVPYTTAAGAAAHRREVAARLGRLPPQQPVVVRPAPAPRPAAPQPADPFAEIGQMMVRLIGACLQTAGGEALTPVTVRAALRQLAAREAPLATVDVGRVREAVAAHYGLTVTDLVSDRCGADTALARHVAIALTRRLTALDAASIGRAFGGRDRSTIRWAVRKIESRAKTGSALAALLDDLTREILAMGEAE